MVRTIIGSITLAAALLPFAQPAEAQNYKQTPAKATIQDYGPFRSDTSKRSNTTPGPGQCGNPAHHCLFYGGDINESPVAPPFILNGLANETTLFAPGIPYGAAVWVPFTVPAGETWIVSGLFTNNQSSYGVLDQGTEPLSVAAWSINEGVFAGNAGTVVASGTSLATSTPTGRGVFDLQEYTVQVTGLSVTLTAGTYWMSVVPVCSNAADPFCDGVFFLSDVEYINTKPTNAFGPPEPVDASFFDAPYFTESFEPTNGPVGACAGDGCDAFSAGVLGKDSD